ncbi:alkylated DNA repair protein [Tieghemostelium lacteum]|uniref:Alkylated DNA repair protein n=1 Tax=Tieghemostelium lacteum TaxID=361077 RepID=A0A152A906_TIELA|nr:alkylated DNA repair protein [Tieghemostelium lacteum]|eukprot:KYR02611.1 alkylated DNA repair protein [Tieghemostelium lacteum]
MYETEVENKSNEDSKKVSEFMRIQKLFRQETRNQYGKQIPKDKRKPLDYSIVLDFHNIEGNIKENRDLIIDCCENVTKNQIDFNKETDFYLEPSQWEVYGLKGYPGFYFIPSPFTDRQQKKWVKDALEIYANPPNSTNLVPFFGKVDNLWQNAVREIRGDKDISIPRPLDKNGKELPTYRSLLDKLTWATLGYQYQWTPRVYSEEFHEKMPEDLKDLVRKIAIATQFDPYTAEAATVNFYSEDSIMGGHLDDAEEEMEKPIISISFGSTAVFLMGGENRDITPIPLFIKSGDIVIMGGRSRYCYHGVAKIVENSFNDQLLQDQNEETRIQMQWIKDKNRRININTRQVFKVPKS